MLVPLTQGKVAIVDDDDWNIVSGFKWYAARCTRNPEVFYAIRRPIIDGRQKPIAMHREILGLSFGDGQEVDHADGDGLNNSRSNLRVCKHSQNVKNRKKSKNSSNLFKSVYRQGLRFRARITVDGKRIHVGMFSSAEEAHAAYVRAAHEFHGEFANDGTHSGR